MASSPIFNKASTARKAKCIRRLSGGKKKLRRKMLAGEREKFRRKPRLKRAEFHRQFLRQHIRSLSTTAAVDLQALAYADFLHSDYWRCVRILVFQRDKYRCQHCGCPNQLHAHHLTYEHHGEEHRFLHDLQTLCDTCHKGAHGLITMPLQQGVQSAAVNRIATTLATSTLTTSKPEEQDASGSGSRNSGHSPEAPMQPRLATPPQRAAWQEWDSMGPKPAQSKVASPE